MHFNNYFERYFGMYFKRNFDKYFKEAFRDAFWLVFRHLIQEVFWEAFRKVGWLNKTLGKSAAKVVDFVPLGALSGPGAPDSNLGRFQIRVWR